MKTESCKIREAIIDVTEEILKAQLFAIRKLKKGKSESDEKESRGKSQVVMAWEVIKKEGAPLHINEIIKGIEKMFKVKVDRESLASAIIKKVLREDRFVRTGKNIYTVR